jgi:integrase
MMGLFKRNGWWWIDYYDAEGRRHRKKASPDHQTAKLILRDTQTAIAKGEVLGVREEGLRLKDFVEKHYWPTVGPTLSPVEHRNRRHRLDTRILPRFGDARVSKLRQEEIESWYAERLQAVAINTANLELAVLKHLLNRAVAWRYLKASPARAVVKRKAPPGRLRYLTSEERKILLRGCVATLYPVVLAALHTGARRSELLNLRWKDCNLKTRTLTFWHTKNGEARTVPMTDALANCLRRLPHPLDPEARIFGQWTPDALSVAFGRLVKRLGLRDLRFHDLRHDFASALTMGGVSQRTIMALLGHKDPRMTLRYQHVSPEHVRDAIRVLDRQTDEQPGAQSAAQ